MSDPIDGQTVPTEALANRVASSLGCSGAHAVGKEWAPCPSREALDYLIKNGSVAYRRWLSEKKAHTVSLHRKDSVAQDVKAHTAGRRYASRRLAEQHAAEIGCSGTHLVSSGYWAPCKTQKELESLDSGNSVLHSIRMARTRNGLSETQPLGRGISNAAGGGLVSAAL